VLLAWVSHCCISVRHMPNGSTVFSLIQGFPFFGGGRR
jgi:hypothetical protein